MIGVPSQASTGMYIHTYIFSTFQNHLTAKDLVRLAWTGINRTTKPLLEKRFITSKACTGLSGNLRSPFRAQFHTDDGNKTAQSDRKENFERSAMTIQVRFIALHEPATMSASSKISLG